MPRTSPAHHVDSVTISRVIACAKAPKCATGGRRCRGDADTRCVRELAPGAQRLPNERACSKTAALSHRFDVELAQRGDIVARMSAPQFSLRRSSRDAKVVWR